MYSDKQIINDLKSTDQITVNNAFESLYIKYSKLIYVCINKYITQKEDCEELTQDVFIKLYNSIDRLDDNRNLKYYLNTTAKNCALDFLKKRTIIYELDNTRVLEQAGTNSNNYKDIIKELALYLDEDEIEILIDRLMWNCTFQEISDNMHIPLGTVSSRYRRALKKFHNRNKGVKK